MMTKDSEARVGRTRCSRCGGMAVTSDRNGFYCEDCIPVQSPKQADAIDPTLDESTDALIDLHAAD